MLGDNPGVAIMMFSLVKQTPDDDGAEIATSKL